MVGGTDVAAPSQTTTGVFAKQIDPDIGIPESGGGNCRTGGHMIFGTSAIREDQITEFASPSSSPLPPTFFIPDHQQTQSLVYPT